MLGNGANTSLLYDRWLPGSSEALISQLSDTQIPGYMHNWMVSDIVEMEAGFLKTSMLLPLWDLIIQQDVPVSTNADTWHWTKTLTGTFNSAWQLVRTREADFQFANVVWFPSHSPKMAGVC